MALLLSVWSLHAFTQDSKLRFGLTVSPQLSWMTAGDASLKKNGSYIGFCYGLLMDLKIPKNYAFSTGIIISYDGGKITYLDSVKFNSLPNNVYPPGTNVDYRLQYVEIPVTMRLMTNQIGYITYFGQFGLNAAINIRSRADVSTLNGTSDETGANFGDDITPANVGLMVGGGLEYEITGTTALMVGLQFFNGFLDVTDNPEEYKSKSSMNRLRLTLGVFF